MSSPRRHWRSYGTDPLPTPQEALGESFAAFPSWFLRIECERCGKVRMLNEAHATDRQRGMQLRDLLARARHEGCSSAICWLVRGMKAAAAGQRRRNC